MNLETRLEKLEHEFNILKNEIQVTLLELQEQVLNRQYPALRAGEDDESEYEAPPAPEMQKSKGARQRPTGERPVFETNGGEERRNGNGKQDRYATNGNSANGTNGRGTNGHNAPEMIDPSDSEHVFPFQDALDDILDDDPDDDHGLNLREISLADFRRPAASGGKRAPLTAKQSPTDGASTVSFAVLADWVIESTRKLGRERTVRAVETYAASGNLTESHRTMIMQLIELAGEDGPSSTPPTADTMEALVKLDRLLRDA